MGQNSTKFLTLINMTDVYKWKQIILVFFIQIEIYFILKVPSNFFIERVNEIPSFDNCFSCLQTTGTLQPYEKQKIPVKQRKIY